MYSKRSLALFVVGVVLLAGCVGGGAGGGVASDGGDGTTGTTDSDRTDDGGSSGDGTSGDGGFEVTDTEAALREARSFTVTWRYAGVDADGVETTVERAFAADLRSERSYTVTSSARDGEGDGAVEQFVADGTTYVRTGSGDDAAYVAYEGETDVLATAIAFSQARAYGADDDLTFWGGETFDGVAVDRYELSEASEALVLAGSAAAADSSDEMQVTSFEYVVLVDEDGLPRYESWSFTGRTEDGRTVSGEWEYALTGVGATTVEDPDWLAEAKQQTP